MAQVLDHIQEHRSDVRDWHLWTSTETMGQALKTSCPEDAQVHLHALQDGNGWRDRFAVLETLRRGLGLVYLFVRRSANLLLQMVSRPSGEEGEEAGIIQREDSDSPVILFATRFPHSWVSTDAEEYDRDVDYVDRYFETAPWRLRDRGCAVAWMPLMPEEATEQWAHRGSQALPDVSSTMELRWSTLASITGTVFMWVAVYLWNFEVRSIDGVWTYRGVDFGGHVRSEIRRAVSGGLGLLQKVEKIRAAGRAVQPDAVLYRNEFYKSGRRISAALQGEATLIGVQHGLIGREHTVYHFHNSEINLSDMNAADHIAHCPLPDYFASFGDRFVGLFEEWEGFPADRVWAVGGLRHDSLMEKYRGMSAKEKTALRTRFGLPLGQPIVLLCTGVRSHVGPWTRMVLGALQTIKTDCVLAVKPHQYHGGEEEARTAAEEMGGANLKLYEEGIYPLIAASDAVVAGGSTVLLEAGLLDTPPVALQPPTSYQHYDFEGVARTATTREELINELKIIFVEGWMPKDVSGHLRNVKQRASDRLLDYIRSHEFSTS